MTASGAILVNRINDPIDFTVADGTGIEKGTLCELTDPRTAKAMTITGTIPNKPVAGISAREKVALSGRTQLAMFRDGIFEMACSGAVALGASVGGCPDNFVKEVTATCVQASGAVVLGQALEAGSDYETIHVQLRLM